MSKYFTINFDRLCRLLLIVELRHPTIIAYVMSVIAPLRNMYSSFSLHRDANLYRLNITPQVFSLEKMLNDRFDNVNRRIFITDGSFYDSLYLFTESESDDIYLFAESENQDIALLGSDETGAIDGDFIVNVPSAISFDDPEMRAALDLYRMVSKFYKILVI